MTMEMEIAMRKAPNTLLLALIKMIALVVCLEDVVNDNDSAGGPRLTVTAAVALAMEEETMVP